MLFYYLRAHWAARYRFPLPSRIASLLRCARVLFRREHRCLFELDVVRDFVAPAAPGELFRHFCCRHYLTRDLPWPMRVSCALHHYRFEDATFGPEYKQMVYLGDGLPLWSEVEGSVTYSILLVRAVGLQAEGDLSVVLLAGGHRLHCISFSWVSGRVVGMDTSVVPFLARNQGCRRSDLDVQRMFNSAFPQNSPNLFCFSAMEGIARAINVPSIVGVRADMQVCYARQEHGHFVNAYDGFWRSLGASDFSQRDCSIPIPISLKPLDQIAAKHRKRAMARRQHWAEICEAAKLAIESHIIEADVRRRPIHSEVDGGITPTALGSNDSDRGERRSRP